MFICYKLICNYAIYSMVITKFKPKKHNNYNWLYVYQFRWNVCLFIRKCRKHHKIKKLTYLYVCNIDRCRQSIKFSYCSLSNMLEPSGYSKLLSASPSNYYRSWMLHYIKALCIVYLTHKPTYPISRSAGNRKIICFFENIYRSFYIIFLN